MSFCLWFLTFCCYAVTLLLWVVLPAASHCESAKLLGVEPHHSDLLHVATVYAFCSLSLNMPLNFLWSNSWSCIISWYAVPVHVLSRNINTFSIKHNMFERHLYHCVFLQELGSYHSLTTGHSCKLLSYTTQHINCCDDEQTLSCQKILQSVTSTVTVVTLQTAE